MGLGFVCLFMYWLWLGFFWWVYCYVRLLWCLRWDCLEGLLEFINFGILVCAFYFGDNFVGIGIEVVASFLFWYWPICRIRSCLSLDVAMEIFWRLWPIFFPGRLLKLLRLLRLLNIRHCMMIYCHWVLMNADRILMDVINWCGRNTSIIPSTLLRILFLFLVDCFEVGLWILMMNFWLGSLIAHWPWWWWRVLGGFWRCSVRKLLCMLRLLGLFWIFWGNHSIFSSNGNMLLVGKSLRLSFAELSIFTQFLRFWFRFFLAVIIN